MLRDWIWVFGTLLQEALRDSFWTLVVIGAAVAGVLSAAILASSI